MKVLLSIVVLMVLIAGCSRTLSQDDATPSGSSSGTCYHPTDGRLYDSAAECAKHGGTWG